MEQLPEPPFLQKRSKTKESGFSLIEILFVLGIVGVISAALMTMMVSQSKEFQAADEKLSLQGIQMMTSNLLSSPAFCGCFIGANTFNYTSKVWNAFPTALSNAYDPAAGCAPLGPTPFLQVGTPSANKKLRPLSMAMEEITETTTGSGNFSAKLTIGFDNDRLTKSRKSIQIPMYFSVRMTDVATARSLVSCASIAVGSGPGGIDLMALCAQMNGVYDTSTTPATCQPTYQ